MVAFSRDLTSVSTVTFMPNTLNTKVWDPSMMHMSSRDMSDRMSWMTSSITSSRYPMGIDTAS